MKKLLIWIWCFPQMLIGFVLSLCVKDNRGDHYRWSINRGSISLGKYIFLCPMHWDDPIALRHEQGHSKQSLYLGWLYVLVIGIPSLIWAGCFEWYRKKYNVSYYAFYTECWADKLSGINRYRE